MEKPKILMGGNISIFTHTGATSGATSAYVPAAWATSSSLSYSREFIDITAKETGNDSYALPGVKSWSMKSDHFHASNMVSGTSTADQFFTMWDNGTLVWISYAPKTSPADEHRYLIDATTTKTVYYGQAYITNVELTAPDKEKATYTISFKGDGKLYLL